MCPSIRLAKSSVSVVVCVCVQPPLLNRHVSLKSLSCAHPASQPHAPRERQIAPAALSLSLQLVIAAQHSHLWGKNERTLSSTHTCTPTHTHRYPLAFKSAAIPPSSSIMQAGTSVRPSFNREKKATEHTDTDTDTEAMLRKRKVPPTPTPTYEGIRVAEHVKTGLKLTTCK
mmetsp:Transcript_9096/g.26191  ORF Transcript_9096/g.26191 Transcript_9096/m.26191 type:complete len:172 (-) Transcript_9096:788-1303(-)